MDSFVDERDHKLLEKDKYTFFVLGKIIGEKCRVLLTDHERMIICHSERPYPVWIWTPDDATDDEKEYIYKIINDEFAGGKGYTFNIKYDLAEYLINKAKADGTDFHIWMNMFAYDCPEPIKPEDAVDGKIHECTMDDVDEIVAIYDHFSKETGIDKQSAEDYRDKAEYSVKNRNLFFWENGDGRHVASCSYRPNGKLASLGLVYTREEYRRRHYAENLVYLVTEKALDEGYMPMLYTNADYVASNACYEKIGYKLRGKLCTLSGG